MGLECDCCRCCNFVEKRENKKMTVFDAKRTIEAYKKNSCNVSKTCEAVGISRTHFYRMRDEDKDFAEGLKEVDEWLIDFAEDKLTGFIRKGNLRALLFFLSRKGAGRGWAEKVETYQPPDPVQVVLPSNGRDDEEVVEKKVKKSKKAKSVKAAKGVKGKKNETDNASKG